MSELTSVYSAQVHAIHALHEELGDAWTVLESPGGNALSQVVSSEQITSVRFASTSISSPLKPAQSLPAIQFAPGEFVAVLELSALNNKVQGAHESADWLAQVRQTDAVTVSLTHLLATLSPWKTLLHNVTKDLPCGRLQQQRARQLLRQLSLAEQTNHWAAWLTRAQRQRVALARAILLKPDYLVLDEALLDADDHSSLALQHLLNQACLTEGLRVVLLTPKLADAIRFTERILLLRQGRLLRQWTVPKSESGNTPSPQLAQLEAEILARIQWESDLVSGSQREEGNCAQPFSFSV